MFRRKLNLYLLTLLLTFSTAIAVVYFYFNFLPIYYKRKIKIRYSLKQINSQFIPKDLPSIRISVIPTGNEKNEIYTPLTSSSQLQYSNFKGVAVNDHSSDDTTTFSNNMNSKFLSYGSKCLIFCNNLLLSSMLSNLRFFMLYT